MKNRFILTKEAFEKVIADLVYLEEEKHNLTDYYLKDVSERDKCNKLIDNYLLHLDQLIKNICLSPSANNIIPFVIIGSEVILQELNSDEFIKLTITLPLKNIDKHCASFLSPIGMCLLLKRVGEIITVDTYRYLIISISLPTQ